MKQGSSRAYIMVILAMLIYGTGGVFRKAIPLSTGVICFFRGLLGSLFIFAYVKLRGGKLRNGLSRKDLLMLILSGALIGINWIFLFEAFNYTTVAIATLCYYMQPTMLMVISPLLFRERLPGVKFLWALVAVLGMLLVSGFPGEFSITSDSMKGVLLGLSAAVLYTGVVILNKFTGKCDTYERTFIQLASAAAAVLPYILFTGTYREIPGFLANGRGFFPMFIMCFVNTGIAYVLYFTGMPRLKAQSVAMLSYIDPVSALFWSALLLHEPLTLKVGLGALLIIGSAIICELMPVTNADAE